ncbi:unnamed protein product [Rotaria sp. Silwood1]|nr:unnamed protein product [Rotaria sp. Silwood1]CAF1491465.1 unnamed protein product [Rotaria sp. Silwood1]CAF3911916.1 unnamed protein product [Rotaria sp. Silwood1]CAF4995481.1 unnamed protein product [Rotaria sp. Silwood1]
MWSLSSDVQNHCVEAIMSLYETMTNHTTQVIECLNKLYDLIPDGIITYEIWDNIMSYSMESIRLEVPEND